MRKKSIGFPSAAGGSCRGWERPAFASAPEGRRRRGRPPIDGEKISETIVSVRVPRALHRAVWCAAQAEKKPFSRKVREILERAFPEIRFR